MRPSFQPFFGRLYSKYPSLTRTQYGTELAWNLANYCAWVSPAAWSAQVDRDFQPDVLRGFGDMRQVGKPDLRLRCKAALRPIIHRLGILSILPIFSFFIKIREKGVTNVGLATEKKDAAIPNCC
jgi:hypothetical protein